MQFVVPVSIAAVSFGLYKKYHASNTILINENQRRAQKIYSGHNRKPEFGFGCDCKGPGFMSKPESDKYNSNNYLPCLCQSQVKDRTTACYNCPKCIKEKESHDSECPDASYGSCHFYQRKMQGINGPKRPEFLEYLLKLRTQRSDGICGTIVGVAPFPKNANGHTIKSKDFYKF